MLQHLGGDSYMTIFEKLIDIQSLFSFSDFIHIHMPIIFLVKKRRLLMKMNNRIIVIFP